MRTVHVREDEENTPELEMVLSGDTETDVRERRVTTRPSVDTEGDASIAAPTRSSSGSDSEAQRITQRILKPIQGIVTPIVTPIANAAETAVGFVFPKIEKIPWYHFMILSVVVSIPAIGYIVGFTKLGFGLQTFYFLSRYYEQHAYVLALSLAGFVVILYLFDFHYWQSKFGQVVKYFAISILILGCATLVCFISTTHPYGPISMYMVLTPLWLVISKRLCYRHLTMRTYVPWLSGPLFFNAVIILAIWLYWTFSTDANEWTEITRLADAQISGCQPDFETYPECERQPGSGDVCFDVDPYNPMPPIYDAYCPPTCERVYDNCANMFIVWVGPFLVSLGLFFLSFFATFLKATGTIEQEALKFAKLWFFLLFVMWVASSLAGAGAGISVTLASLTLSAFVASSILLASSFNHIERGERVQQVWSNLIEKYRKYLNLAKGLLVVTSAPVFVVYLALSFLNQGVRNIKLKLCCSKDSKVNTESLRDVIGAGLVTNEARRLIKEIKSWDLVDVFTYAVYWGIGFMTFCVLASKFTTLFLSWIIQRALNMSIPLVTGILLGVGVVMFLLPPVPGAPIYLTFGIVIVPVGRPILGLAGSIGYAMAVSLILKLFATFLQQKMIGGLLKNNVGVRKMVGINTPLMRAFKLVLKERGFSNAKICILCGGPDWPTSVLCGIMDLPLAPILVGTLPVIFLVIPTVLAGSFTYMSNLKLPDNQPEFAWAGTAATISMAAAAIVLSCFMLFAAYFVELTMRERDDEIASIPVDEEVKKLDDETTLMNEAYKEVTQWHLVPSWVRFFLTLSVICMIMSCYMVQLFQEDAFTSYQLTDTIHDRLHGDWKNLVKPLGFSALLLFCASIFFYNIFSCWAKWKAKKKYAEKYKGASTDEEDGSATIESRNAVALDGRLSHVDDNLGVSVYAAGSV